SASTAGGGLILESSGTSGGLTVNAVIANNTSASALTKAGSGTVTLAAPNTFSGATALNEGALVLADVAALQNSTLTLGRLIHELACCGRLEASLGEQLIADLEAMPHYSVQPFFRLLRSRIRFLQGSYSDALAETDTVLAFSRQKHNRLHVVAAALQKAMLLTAGEEPVAWRSLGNLLREALHDAAEDQLRMPFFLERHTLTPLLGRLATEAVGKDALPAGDAAFLRDILVLCQTNMGTLSKAKKTQDTLSAREQEVLCALARGLSNREIAEALFISQATVKTHVLSVFNKLGVSSRLLAAEEGRLRGLIR
ncbi:MAG: hypothetical protein EOM69_12510, partial [Clostridia bacterium]|nr:hypothetical protein [Clostridia bacterium]